MGSTTLLLHAPLEFILASFQTVDFVDISISDVNTSLLKKMEASYSFPQIKRRS